MEDKQWFENLESYIDIVVKIDTILSDEVKENSISQDTVIESFVTVKPPVVIQKGTKILSGAYIEGPTVIGRNCYIGPNCHIRPYCVIGNGVTIGQGAEIKASILMDKCKISHFAYIGNSLLGRNVNIAAGVITAVRRFDNQNVVIFLPTGKKYNTGKYKFGSIIGDNVQVGIGVLILPGRIIKPNSTIDHRIIVKNNVLR